MAASSAALSCWSRSACPAGILVRVRLTEANASRAHSSAGKPVSGPGAFGARADSVGWMTELQDPSATSGHGAGCRDVLSDGRRRQGPRIVETRELEETLGVAGKHNGSV